MEFIGVKTNSEMKPNNGPFIIAMIVLFIIELLPLFTNQFANMKI